MRMGIQLWAVLVAATSLTTGFCEEGEDSLLAHWSFDRDEAGIVFDSGPGELHGTAYNIAYGRGVMGRAAVFEAGQGEIHVPAYAVDPPEAVGELAFGTISVWFNFEDVGGQMLPIFYFGEADTGTRHNSLIIEIGHRDKPENRKLYFTIINARFCYDSGTNLEPGQWYHFAAVVSPEGNTGYLNGQEMTKRHYNLGSNAADTDFFSSVPEQEMLAIGYGRYGLADRFYHFQGQIDDVRIYERPLNVEAVARLYEGAFGPVPTYEDVAYGPYERNVMDFWQADANEAAAVVVYIHGGGFRAGDKRSIRTSSGLAEIARYREQGVSFAAINYRFRTTATLDEIMLDCARAVQFLRHQAEAWNLDTTRIAAYGGSAGGGAALWLGFHDDLADPNSDDPVQRQSTRLTAIGHLNSQATYDFEKWPEILDIDPNWAQVMHSVEDLDLYGITDRSQLRDPNIVAMRAFLDMPSFMDANDPPLYTSNLRPDTVPQGPNEVIHHPRHALYLASQCDLVGIPCIAVLADTPPEERVRLVDFFLAHLLPLPTDENEL